MFFVHFDEIYQKNFRKISKKSRRKLSNPGKKMKIMEKR